MAAMDQPRTINVYEAKTHLSQLIERALGGEDVVICRAGKAMVRLVPVQAPAALRTPGGWEGRVRMPDDDELPEDLAAAFRGERP